MRIFLASILLISGVIAQADSDVTAVSDQASQLIQGYITQNPDVVSNSTQTQNQISDDIQSVGNLSQGSIAAKINAVTPTTARLPSLYPIESHALTPGPVQSRLIPLDLLTPIAIVGDDDLSKAWLKRHQKELIADHAEIMVVNINSDTDREALQAGFPGLSLIPLNGDSLATSIQLIHYPVLISGHLITQ